MAQANSSKKLLFASYHTFKSVDTRTGHSGKESICEMKNFKMLPDGSIKRRPGYKTIFSADSTIRTIWSGNIDGYNSCYFIAKNKIYQLYEAMNAASALATISSSSGKAEMFFLRDALYVIDGSQMYRLKNGTLSTVSGYVPLFGKDWPVGKLGEINEPLNILTRRARITYNAGSSPNAYLLTMYPVESVHSIYRNGELVSSGSYAIDTQLNTINLMGIQSGDSIEVDLTFAPRITDNINSLLSCTCATVFGGINNSRLFMWNGNKNSVIYASRYVSDQSVAEAQKRCPDCGHIYFPEGCDITVGNGNYPVKAVARHFDRLIILTSHDAWVANNSTCDSEPIPIMNINSSIGCPVVHGAVTIGNDPISIGKSGIYKWTSKTDELNEANAVSISDPISDLFENYYLQNGIIFADKDNRQIWLTSSRANGSVWIYDLDKDSWFAYDNVNANMFFKSGDNIGFINGNNICVFDETLEEDLCTFGSTAGTKIIATLQSGMLDFETPRIKKLSSVVMKGDLNGISTELDIFCDNGEHIHSTLNSSADLHSIISKRLFSNRFRSLYFKLTVKGSSQGKLHSLYLMAR